MYKVPSICLMLFSWLPAYTAYEKSSQQIARDLNKSSSATYLSKALPWYASRRFRVAVLARYGLVGRSY